MTALAMNAFVAAGLGAAGALELRPTLGLSVRHDDNLFARPDERTRSRSLGVEPALLLLHRRARWTVTAEAMQAAERHAEHPEIDTLNARRSVSLRAESHLTRRLEAAIHLSDFRTRAAGNLSGAPRIDFGRRAARQRQLAPSFTYAMTRTTALTADLAAVDDAVDGAPPLSSVTGGVGLDRRVSRQTGFGARYQLRRYRFGPGPADVSQRVGVLGRHVVGRSMEVAVDVGPRVSRGRIRAEWTTSARLHLRPVEIHGEWSEGETAIVGASSPAMVRRAGLSASTAIGRAYARVAFDTLRSREASRADLRCASAEAGYRLASPIAVSGTTAWNYQRTDSIQPNPGDIRRTVTELRLVFTPGAARKETRVGR
jgi:hypothetical protein